MESEGLPKQPIPKDELKPAEGEMHMAGPVMRVEKSVNEFDQPELTHERSLQETEIEEESQTREIRRQEMRTEVADMIKNKIVGRGFREYRKLLGLDENELKGKHILDIGAGAARFAKQAAGKGILVTPIDPMYAFPEGQLLYRRQGFRDFLSNLKSSFGKLITNSSEESETGRNEVAPVAAVAEKLPFREGSFDLITALCSSFLYAKSPKEMDEDLEEALRVLKPSGKILIWPNASDTEIEVRPIPLFVGKDEHVDFSFLRTMNREFQKSLSARENQQRIKYWIVKDKKQDRRFALNLLVVEKQ